KVPASIRSSVDFPEPFGPISPIRSFSEIVNEILSKSGIAPNVFEIPCALMMGGKRRSPEMRVSSRITATAPLRDEQARLLDFQGPATQDAAAGRWRIRCRAASLR